MPQNEQLFEVARRTFDTPEFRGITFIEAEAKSIINKVPGGPMPFSWTINPYRGCTHACVYCLWGETPILMGDGTTKRIADVAVGDEVYGTTREGNYRRYTKTRVLAHWSTMKPAYRIMLEDGTHLVASADHRFLTNRGWKHVIGSESGALQRPHLTPNNKLIGTGSFAEAPKFGADYKQGYLCGMIRGDGHLKRHDYVRRNGRLSHVYAFRLALVDGDALRRSRAYLAEAGVATPAEFLFQPATSTRKPVFAIRAATKAAFDLISTIIEWPEEPTNGWRKGFLAGIFDAEGSCSQVIRICNTDGEIIARIRECFDVLGFTYVIEPSGRPNGLVNVRIVGGLRERLRFFHTTEPAIMRKRNIERTALKSNAKLGVVSVVPLGLSLPMYDITTGTGDFIANGVISHNCFARVTHTYLDMNAGDDFERKIVVKINAPELLRAELRSRRWKGEHIAMGTGTDPYQRAEGRYRLMPPIIEALTEWRNPFSILTKGTLITRDLELLQDAVRVADVSTALSIGTLDEEVWRRAEPGTPHPRERMKAVARLNEAGIPCSVLMAPILPGINDTLEQMRAVVRAAIDAGATSVSPILLHLRPVVREEYMAWLARDYPTLVEPTERMYARGSYASSADKRALGTKVGRLLREEGGVRLRPEVAWRIAKRSHPAGKALREPKQLRLL